MPELHFTIGGAEVATFAAVPTLQFKLDISNAPEQERIHSIALRCQVQIEVKKRRYDASEQVRLLELFGEPQRWGETLRNLLWLHVSTVVPSFVARTTVALPVACTYDFDVVSTKYFAALEQGEIPLIFLFSGTIFYLGAHDRLQIAQIPWSQEATYRLPVALWHDMMAHYYPNSAWLRLHKDIFDELYHYKAKHCLPTWDDTISHLLEASKKEVHP
jgi:hypothetical protein